LILLLDNIIFTFLNIYSSFILINLFNFKIKNFFLILLIDIILYKLPLISISLIILYLINYIIFKNIRKNKKTKFIIIILDYIIFISLIYIFNDYDNYLYFLIDNYRSHIFNILIYYIYIFLV